MGGIHKDHKNSAKSPSPEKALKNYSQQKMTVRDIWNAELLNAWVLDKKLGYAAGRFVSRIRGESAGKSDRMFEIMEELCKAHDIQNAGFTHRLNAEGQLEENRARWKMRVTDYIRLACPKLHKVIIGGKYQTRSLWQYMDRFVFKQVMQYRSNKKLNLARANAARKYKSTIHINARSLAPDQDWNKVK